VTQAIQVDEVDGEEGASLISSSLLSPQLHRSDGSSTLSEVYNTIMAFQRHGMPLDDGLPWPFHLLHILFGYSLVIVPAALFIRYVRGRSRGSAAIHEPTSLIGKAIRAFAIGRPEYSLLGGEEPEKRREDADEVHLNRRRCFKDGLLLLAMFTGIQITLVAMGYLQEEVMTTGYQREGDSEQFDRFRDGQFLIFCNRIVALAVCVIVLGASWTRQPPHVPPFYKHAFTSFSNTMSAWCQYEALKYVSFPTQTICKASKVAATMVMGVIVRGQRYSLGESLCGAGITIGASLFLLSAPAEEGKQKETATTISGIILMLGYLAFDAFTLNWQKALFDTRPKVSKYQMMLGVNLFSAVLCAVSLWEQGSLSDSISFALSHNGFAKDAFLLSLSGAVGQLFIYTTIEKFGPIVFAVIMTIRQMISIIVSTVSYGHAMTAVGFLGFCIVFGSIFGDIYRRYSQRSRK
ncbi:hypothetical protein PFISCL1PPCAC_2132, partial [Pristionchus fissidentatus]